MELSQAAQDYLKAIYQLSQQSRRASTSALAAHLHVTAASVTGMLRQLAEFELVIYEPYRGVTLTAKGRRLALEVIRHHRLLEAYLMQVMGYSWDRVHDEAERLEHAISEEFEERISHILGNPSHDPHGDPIPSKDGEMASVSNLQLDCAPTDQPLRIERVRDENPRVLQSLAKIGMTPHTIITVCSTDSKGTEVRKQNGERYLLAPELARSVFVVLINNDAAVDV
ncbi:MAG: metal-dependent transcriptional regulator [Thermoflexales bacterium]